MTNCFHYKFPCLVFACLLWLFRANAQAPVSDSSLRSAAIHYASGQYTSYLGTAAPLYTGPQYTEYHQTIQQGHPFFMDTAFLPGSVWYDHILYENIFLRFDVIQGRIVLNDATKTFRITPVSEKIDSFIIKGHHFHRIDKTSLTQGLPRTGFYEILYSNQQVALLKKENKSIQEDLRSSAELSKRYIVASDNYYIQSGNLFIPVNRKNQLLDYCKDRKAEIRQYIRKQQLDFSEDKENAMISVIAYYQSLHN